MKKLFLFFLLSFIVLSFAPVTVRALDLGGDLAGDAAKQAGYEPDTDNLTLAKKVGQVIKVASSFLGVIFTALMVYAGFLWMLARGDEAKVEKAKTLIRAAIIGLFIILSAYSISFYITSNLFAQQP